MQLNRQHLKSCLALLFALALVQYTAQAKASDTGDTVWLQVNQLSLSARAYSLLYRGLDQASDKALSTATLNRGIIENQLLAERALAENSLAELHPQRHIDFPFQVLVDDQLANFYRLVYNRQLEAYLARSGVKKQHGLAQFITYMVDFKQLNLKQDLADSTARKLMSFRLSQGQEQSLDLMQLVSLLNVQGRHELSKNNLHFLQQQLQNYLTKQVIFDWVKNYSGLSLLDQQAFAQIMRNKELKKLYLAQQGLVHLLHKDNAVLAKRAKSISQMQINAYYQQHKEDYREVEQARILLFSSYNKRDLDKLKDTLQQQKHPSFTQLKQAHNDFIQAHKQSVEALPNGVIELKRQQHQQAFLRTLAFSLPQHELSQVLRSPMISAQGKSLKPHWLMLWVEQRQSGYLAADSEGVRYEVGKILAAKAMAKEYDELLAKLNDKADIRIDKKALASFQVQQQQAKRDKS